MKALKTISLIALVAAAFVIGMTSCVNSNFNQNALIGTWKYTYTHSENMDDGDIEGSMSGTSTYNTDGTFSGNYIVSYNTTWADEESYLDGISLKLSYRIKVTGTYDISGNSLDETTKDVNVSFISGNSNIPYGYSNIERELINNFRKELENNNYAEFKKEFYGTSTYTIVNIDANKMVLRDDKGDIDEYYKVN